MEIQIKGTIVSDDDKDMYDFFHVSCINPKAVHDALKCANGDDVDIYINSGGGDLIAGTEIYSAIKAYTGAVRIHVTGLAASAASLIMCAGKCDITPPSLVMIHNVSSIAYGDHNELAHESETLRTADRAVAAAYIEKTGKSEEELLELMDKETWLTAAEAVELGLCDEVKGKQVLTNAYCTILSQQHREEYKNAKAKALAQVKLERLKTR